MIRSRLNLLASETRIKKRSKSTEQLNSNRRLDSADYLPLLNGFTSNSKIFICFAALVKKAGGVFMIIGLLVRV